MIAFPLGLQDPGISHGQLIFELRQGFLRHQRLDDLGLGETEIPTYLQSDSSTLGAQVQLDLFALHPHYQILMPSR